VAHNKLTGFEVRYYRDDFSIGVLPPENPLTPGVPGRPSIILYDPVETATYGGAVPYLDGDSSSTDYAPYVTDQMVFSEKFELLVGARYDAISRDDTRNTAGPPAFSEDLSRSDSKVSPMLGVVWAPTQTFSLYGNAARLFGL